MLDSRFRGNDTHTASTHRHSGQAQREPESRPFASDALALLQRQFWIPAPRFLDGFNASIRASRILS